MIIIIATAEELTATLNAILKTNETTPPEPAEKQISSSATAPTVINWCADLATMQPQQTPAANNKTTKTNNRGRPHQYKQQILQYAKEQIDITGKIPTPAKVSNALGVNYKTAYNVLRNAREELEDYQRQHEEQLYKPLLNINTRPDKELKDAVGEEGE
jgi:hypothetical protein